MADNEEFIILLGDEDADSQSPDVEAAKGCEASGRLRNEPSDEFVVLLGEPETADEIATVPIQMEAQIENVAALYQQLAEVLAESSGDLKLDIAAVEQVDSAGLQLLAVLQRRLLLDNRKLTYSGASDNVKAAITRAGFGPILGGVE